MCAEKIEELPDTSNGSLTQPKSSSSWAPALTVLLLLPVISFVLSDFVLFPRLQVRFEQVAGQIKMPDDGIQAVNVSRQGAKKSTYEIKDIMSNISAEGQVRYARVSFVLEGSLENFEEIIKANEARIIDATLDVFSVLSVSEISNPNIKSIVKQQLLQRFEVSLEGKIVENLFFSQFVIK